MGEVYKARDGRLGRTVAVKVLPEAAAADPSFRARFEREARAIAALSHPHICAIYDVGQSADAGHAVDFIVMEYLEGETLADRLNRAGALPLDQVLTIGVAVADALDRAHRAGIVHRDFKPANVMLSRSGPKLLDFGLAKPLHDDTGNETTKALTDRHTIVGTIHYMAPEQVEGRAPDPRTDLWALGVMLYEMATAQRPFGGESAASVMSAILRDPAPPVSARQALTPSSFDHLVDRCLQKDPEERWQTAGDLKRELQWIASQMTGNAIASSPRTPARQTRGAWWYAVAALIAGAAAGALIAIRVANPASTTDALESIALSVQPPPGTSFPLEIGAPWPSISPDGRQLAFVAVTSNGTQQIWLRPLDTDVARPLAGTEGAARPFWSPDNRAVGFFADGKIKRVDLPNGSPQVVCDAPYLGGMSATWGSQGVIAFTHVGGIFRVPASGGSPQRVLTDVADSTRWDSPHNPSFLPDGRHFVYVVQRTSREEDEICVASIDSGDPRCVLKVSSPARYAEPGYLLFVRDGALRLQTFNADRFELTGESMPVASTYVNVEPVYGRRRFRSRRERSLTTLVLGRHVLPGWIATAGSSPPLASAETSARRYPAMERASSSAGAIDRTQETLICGRAIPTAARGRGLHSTRHPRTAPFFLPTARRWCMQPSGRHNRVVGEGDERSRHAAAIAGIPGYERGIASGLVF